MSFFPFDCNANILFESLVVITTHLAKSIRNAILTVPRVITLWINLIHSVNQVDTLLIVDTILSLFNSFAYAYLHVNGSNPHDKIYLETGSTSRVYIFEIGKRNLLCYLTNGMGSDVFCGAAIILMLRV